MGGIEKQAESVFVSQFLQRRYGCTAAPEMNAHYSARALRDHTTYGFRVEVVGDRINVRENWCDALPVQRVGCCNKGIGRNDDLTFQPGRPNCYFERNRAITHRDAVFHFVIIGYAFLEFLHDRAIIG
jgi:hypothetical protein